jgi:hypothetical protein
MDAGREMDAWCAEKVMGWTKRISADHSNSPIKTLREMGVIYAWKDNKRKERGLDVPPFSTDIAAAWQVIEHFYRAGWGAGAEMDGHTGCRAFVGQFTAEADTAPHAICLAALKAVLALALLYQEAGR